jgi:peptide/nickel transport system substrate-binding protein
VERLLPTEAAAIQDPEIVVHRYGLISMYFLVPNNQSKLSSNRVFRRGVVYALPRENMLNQLILLGRSFSGCDVLSGPFHSGFDRNDPMAYAYDGQIKPRTFDPALGATLIAMGWHLTELDAMDQQELAAESDHPLVDETQNDDHKTGVVDTSDSDTKRIVIVHADDAILASLADLICRSLRTAGVHCESRRLASGESRPPANESWHLWLTDFTAREPIIDIFHMFGPTGLVTKPSAYVQQALNELAEVKRWSDARAVLNRLHELVHNELSVIPLWQLTNHYAYRRGLQGLSDNAMTLYQDIDLWSVERTDVQ